MEPPPPPAPQGSTSQGKGCVFWGCLSLVIIGVLIGSCVGIGSFFLYRQFKELTSDEPAELPVRETRPGEYEGLERKLEDFQQAAEASAEIQLTADDLNLFLAGNEELKRFARYAHVQIDGDQVVLEVSLPLDEIVPAARKLVPGRYFNGTLGVSLSLDGGLLVGTVESASVKGVPVPDTVVSEIGKENLFKNAQLPSKLEAFLETAKSLEVRDGKVILRR